MQNELYGVSFIFGKKVKYNLLIENKMERCDAIAAVGT